MKGKGLQTMAEKKGRKGFLELTLPFFAIMILTVLLVYGVVRFTSMVLVPNSAQARIRNSITSISETLTKVCKNEAISYSGGLPTISLPKESSIYVLSCEGVETLVSIPQYSETDSKFHQKDVSLYRGWDNILLECTRVPDANKRKRIQIIHFTVKMVWETPPPSPGSGGFSMPYQSPEYSATAFPVDCPMHEFSPPTGEGEFYGGTSQKVEIGIGNSNEVYILTRSDITTVS